MAASPFMEEAQVLGVRPWHATSCDTWGRGNPTWHNRFITGLHLPISGSNLLTLGPPVQTWKQLRAILLLPGMVLGVIPALIVYFTGVDSDGLWSSYPANRFILPIIGLILIGLGLSLMIATIRLIGTVGKGTLAPWNPPQRLVVQGIYRHVRNPMMKPLDAELRRSARYSLGSVVQPQKLART
jgi:hypothetical protein